MQNIGRGNEDGFERRTAMFGRSLRLFSSSFSPRAIRRIPGSTFRHYFTVMGLNSLPLITIGSVFVSLALTTQVVIEGARFNAQDMSGAAIALGLLRELGPLTVGLAWTGRTAAFLCDVAFAEGITGEREFSGEFLAPAYIAGIASALPLAAYGLALGFGAAALFAPLIGVSSSADFLESARLVIHDKDIAVYLLKLVVINPTIVVFATCLACLHATEKQSSVSAAAITYASIGVFIANLICTWAWYLP